MTQVDTTTLIPAGWYVERTSGVAMVLTNMVLTNMVLADMVLAEEA